MINPFRLASMFAIAVYFVLGIVTLPFYGVNWDEVNHLTRGHAYLNFFLTGKENYDEQLFEEGSRRSLYQIKGYDFTYQKVKDGDHPVFSDIASASFNYIFYQKLGLFTDADSAHIFGPVLVSLFLIFLYFFMEKIYDGFAAFISVIALILYPLFYGESHFNVQKDIPQAVFYSLAILSFYNGYIKKSAARIILSALFFGCALGTKFNVLFMPIIILFWLLVKEHIYFLGRLKSLPMPIVFSLSLLPFIGFGIFYFSWPHLWFDPFKNILQVVTYYKDSGILSVPSMPDSYYIGGYNTYAIQWVLYTTPLITLFLSSLGVLYALTHGWREKNKFSLLVLLWFLLPIARVSVPSASIYGGVRHIMEYIPAMAILSGIGASYLVSLLRPRIQKVFRVSRKARNEKGIIILHFLIVLSFVPITVKIFSLFPNESIYFNPLIGGLKGAQEKDIPGWGNSLGSTYRQGVDWLNKHAEKNAKVVFVYELGSNIPYTLLRKDIQLSNTYRSGPKKSGEYIIGVTHDNTYENYYHRRYVERFLVPVYQVQVENVPVLKIWKNDKKHLSPTFAGDEKEIPGIHVAKDVSKGMILITFPRTVRLTRLVIEYNAENCVIPIAGLIRISKDNKSWRSLPGSFLDFSGFSWFKPAAENGKLEYLFADDVRSIRMIRNTEDSCLLKEIAINAWEV